MRREPRADGRDSKDAMGRDARKREPGRIRRVMDRARNEGIHLSFSSWLQLLTFALAFGSIVGGPIIYACFEMRQASQLIGEHVHDAQAEFREAREDRRQMDRRIYVLESRLGSR